MKKLLAITLGILTAIGGFVDIGDIVSTSEAGSRFGLAHTWVLIVGVIGICVYAEMAGRVTVVSTRPVFDLIRERLGPRAALVNLLGSYLITLLTLAAEIGGVALALQLISGAPYLLWVPAVALVLWLALWRVRFETLERIFGLGGLALVILVVGIFWLHPPFDTLRAQTISTSPPPGENWPTYWFLAVALFASAMTPYEVFFFSSGGVEERWTPRDLTLSRINVFLGFPLGGLLAFGFLATSAIVFHPLQVSVDTLGQAVLPAGLAFGQVGLGLIILGVFAATFGAAMETSLSAGYAVAQYFGWSWGKALRPRQAARFHTVVLISILLAVAALLSTIDPIQLTEYMLIFSAVVLPLTYLPILIIANDRGYLGDRVNGPFANTLGVVYLVVVAAAAVAAIPLMVMTGMGG
ncbi:Mn2+ and Fe2+ transporters of the NRAMP family [Micromonospora sediminicola]|uniref:Mn2+ and Fe2+ transporters of the NRAMP family n=1 Tax=Micromonospora sediminicola TaxID=946078 RepID=A0A1A9B8E6_9ACTN|nr:divalent metal cation transporter [Micromonospora sediminicola]SBT65795.1 Mn2+ and Fe2+ transporters of the NRAMP family [Micromonospora sediminicola]